MSGSHRAGLSVEVLPSVLLVLIPSSKALATNRYRRDLWSNPVQLLRRKKCSAEVRKVTLSTTCPCTNNQPPLHVQNRAGCCKNMETEIKHLMNLPQTTHQRKRGPRASLVSVFWFRRWQMAFQITMEDAAFHQRGKLTRPEVWYFQDEMQMP